MLQQPDAIRVLPADRAGPLILPRHHRDTKDPCPVFDGRIWHLFGTVGSSLVEVWQILHAVADAPEGPWIEQDPLILSGVAGDRVAAPGVIFDQDSQLFHMFIHTDFMSLGGRVEHLVSPDGCVFERLDSPLLTIADTEEAGIYDPHPSDIGGEKFLVYSANRVVARPDLFLARSVNGSWDGPWERLGCVLRHEHVPHHNQHDHPDYEWGLEGAQILRLPGGMHLLIAVCFLPEGKRGQRQRVFFAGSKEAAGPYHSLGPILEPRSETDWESGENGHACAVLRGDELILFYQSRSADEANNPWRYGMTRFKAADIEAFAARVIGSDADIRV